nr:unnamed protein product [Digitaria exilis]
MVCFRQHLRIDHLFELSGTENFRQSSVSFKDFCVSVCPEENNLMKIQVSVSGTMTDSVFEKVFTKKGKLQICTNLLITPFVALKIPKEVALHLIGPSKVKKETITKIINCTVAEYVRKEGLTASKDLKVQQSYEELEAAFEPGKEFCFDATVHLQ